MTKRQHGNRESKKPKRAVPPKPMRSVDMPGFAGRETGSPPPMR